jgi:hypothetical protein
MTMQHHHGLPSAVAERWFDTIPSTADPWRRWFGMVQFPQYDPSDARLARIEHYVEEICRAADKRRLAIKPETERFADMWATFRKHHENLEGG